MNWCLSALKVNKFKALPRILMLRHLSLQMLRTVIVTTTTIVLFQTWPQLTKWPMAPELVFIPEPLKCHLNFSRIKVTMVGVQSMEV